MGNQVDKLIKKEMADKPVLSRAHLLEIEEDPTRIETVARLMGAVNLDNLFRFMQQPDTAVTAKLEFQKMLNRMGRLEPDTKTSTGGGPQVVINITRAKDAEHGVTIEGETVDAGNT